MKKNTNSDNVRLKKGILESLIKNPCRSDADIANELGTYREKVWRTRECFEDTKAIWGYSAIIDDKKMNRASHIIFMKFKTLSADLIDALLLTLKPEYISKFEVNLKGVCYINSEYDCIIIFSAPDRTSTSKYYEFLKKELGKYLAEKPTMVDIAFCIASCGFLNPDIEKLHDFVPE